MKKEIVDSIYKAYGSDSGVLLGIRERSVVEAIVEFTLNRIPATPVKDAGQSDKQEQTETGGFTKGEWIVADFGEEIAIKEKSLLGKDNKWMFADRICTMGNYTTQNKANAELIVKAINNFPAMYEALKTAKEYLAALVEENHEELKQWVAADVYTIIWQTLTRINKD